MGAGFTKLQTTKPSLEVESNCIDRRSGDRPIRTRFSLPQNAKTYAGQSWHQSARTAVPLRLKLVLVEAAFQMEMDENRGGGDDNSAQSLSQRRVSFLEALPTVLIAAPSDLF